MDVNLGPEKTERIVVYEGDRSEDLAENFARIHSNLKKFFLLVIIQTFYNYKDLDNGMKIKLKEMLDSQIDGILTRIDEEQNNSEEEVSGEEEEEEEEDQDEVSEKLNKERHENQPLEMQRDYDE